MTDKPVSIGGKLYFTNEQWLGGQKKGERSSADGHKRRKPCRAPKVCGVRESDDGDNKCYNYGRTGHRARECEQPRRGQAHVESRRAQAHIEPRRSQAHISQVVVDDEEPALL
jgi:hypothetical protein